MNVGGRRKLDKSFEKKRIEVLTSFDSFDKNKVKTGTQLRWCGDVVKRVSDETDKAPGARTRRFKENEAALIEWDPVKELGEKEGETHGRYCLRRSRTKIAMELGELTWVKMIMGLKNKALHTRDACHLKTKHCFSNVFTVFVKLLGSA